MSFLGRGVCLARILKAANGGSLPCANTADWLGHCPLCGAPMVGMGMDGTPRRVLLLAKSMDCPMQVPPREPASGTATPRITRPVARGPVSELQTVGVS